MDSIWRTVQEEEASEKFPFILWAMGAIKTFYLKNDNILGRLIQQVHEEWVEGEGNSKPNKAF